MVRFKGLSLFGQQSGFRGFHPTMVRFKANAAAALPTDRNSFHPTMVRFKGVIRRDVQYFDLPFPSHYGAI